jgi:hypothetical protein
LQCSREMGPVQENTSIEKCSDSSIVIGFF